MNKVKVGIIDYGIGNIRSIANAVAKVGGEPILADSKELLLSCDAAILPGVGAFKAGIHQLESRHLRAPIELFIEKEKPLLGICLGMQLLFEWGEEFGGAAGLGVLTGKVSRLPLQAGSLSRLPNICWQNISAHPSQKWAKSILSESQSGPYYFVHSYSVRPDAPEDILALSTFDGRKFVAAVNHGNLWGVQFHPEKSRDAGLALIKEFINRS